MTHAHCILSAMRVYAAAVAAAIILATMSAIGMQISQMSSADAYTTGSARLDQQEAVNSYGRSANPDANMGS